MKYNNTTRKVLNLYGCGGRAKFEGGVRNVSDYTDPNYGQALQYMPIIGTTQLATSDNRGLVARDTQTPKFKGTGIDNASIGGVAGLVGGGLGMIDTYSNAGKDLEDQKQISDLILDLGH